MIKLFQPYVSDEARANVQRVLKSNQLAEGPEVKLFEEEFAKKFGFEAWQIVSLNSGTAALELAYELCNLTERDHVVAPVLTCTATNIPLVRRKVNMSFADIDGVNCFNLEPQSVEDNITATTKAVVFVHFGGSSKNLDEIEAICEDRGVDLICDAAQALGARLSKAARFSIISLQAIKSLTAGDGGVLICRDERDAKKARKLRWFGYDRELKQQLGDCDLELAGFKYHMNDISAAIARGNLSRWDEIVEHRQAINDAYEAKAPKNWNHSFIPGIWNPVVTGINYEKMKERAESHGFEIGQYHYRNDKYKIFQAAYSNCPNMDDLEELYFMLPCHMGMTVDDAELIAGVIWHK